MSQVTEDNGLLEQLTREAVDAASEGKWDQVAQLYEHRTRSGLLEKVSPDLAKKLLPSDQWIMSRIREVQALTQQQLREAQDHRRKFETLKRQWVGSNTVQTRHRSSV